MENDLFNKRDGLEVGVTDVESVEDNIPLTVDNYVLREN